MQAVLVMFRSDGERRSFSIARDMTVIGRREDCDLRIPLGEVSRKHCRLIRDGDTLKLEDLGSSNGTYLNGQRVQEALLSPGDTVQVGPVVFVLQVDGEPADEDLKPVIMEPSEEEPVALGDDDAPTLEPNSLEPEALEAEEGEAAGHRGQSRGGNGAEEVDELQPVGDSEDAAFDILSSDAEPVDTDDLRIDLDAEEHTEEQGSSPR
jgi:pSer/pThr/pTyr-binding forkhead associated (FHA) protein